MNLRNIILIGVTAIVIWAAVTVTRQNAPETDVTTAMLYPELVDQINGVERIEIRSGDEHTVLRRQAENWTIENRGDFPARFQEIRRVLFELTELKVLEKKTSKPEKYSLLGVEDVDSDKSTSKLVTVSGAAELPLARLLVGKPRKAGGNATPARYVRRADDPQALLVEGELEISPDPMKWLDNAIADISSDRVRQVSLQPYQEPPVVIAKNTRGEKFFELKNIPAGHTVRSKTTVSNLGAVLKSLRFDDVASAAVIDRNTVARSILELQTFDGLVATVEQLDHRDKVYFRFNFAFNPDAVTETETVPIEAEADEAPADEPAAASQETPEADDEAAETPSVEGEAARLNAVVAEWLFELPDYKLRLFDQKFDNMIKVEEPPAETAEQPE